MMNDPDFLAACRRMNEDFERLVAAWAAAVTAAMKTSGKANTRPR